MIGRLALCAVLALTVACKNDKAPAADTTKTGAVGSAGPAQEGSAKPQPSEATPDGSKAPPMLDAAPAAAGPTWETYTSKDGGFSIELPGKVMEQDQSGLKIAMAEFGTTVDDARTATCGVAFMRLPGTADTKTVLEGAIARHKQDATVIEDKDITLGKHPGKSLIVKNDKHQKWMRVYLADKTIYIVNCGGPFDRAATDAPIAQKALASFALAK